MVRALVVTAGFLVAAALLLLIVLAFRRMLLARRERRDAAAERRVRPIGIALVEGQETDRPTLSSSEQAILADVLGRYSRKLTGDADARIAEYFRASNALERPLRELRSRRAWTRAAAAYRLGDLGCEEAAPALLEALDDRDRTVR